MDKRELNRLNSIANVSWYIKGIATNTTLYSLELFKRYLNAGSILELGSAEGVMTDLLVKITDDLTIVEGASTFCESIQMRHPDIYVVNSLI